MSSLIKAVVSVFQAGSIFNPFSFFVNMVVSFALSTIVNSIFGKKQPTITNAENGVRQQIPPSTINSLPVVYGEASLGAAFIDAALSTDQQQMYYVLAISSISPNGTFTFDTTQMYFGDRLITFGPNTSNPNNITIVSLTDSAGNVDPGIYGGHGTTTILLYTADSAGNITPQNSNIMPWEPGFHSYAMGPDSGLPPALQWNPTNRKMYNIAFAIVRMQYAVDAGATQLQPITFKVKQTLNGASVANPGDVWYDYMKNTQYGGAVDLDLLDADSANALNTYSQQLITFTNNSGNPATQARYTINGVIDTTRPVLDNINEILNACDSWMTYNSVSGKWSIIINRDTAASLNFNDTNIIGDIKTTLTDINQSINQIEAKFPNNLNKDIPAYVFIKTPDALLFPNEPVNKFTMNLSLVNNSVQAQYLANRILEQAREDLIVTFKTTFYGIQATAGDVVSVTNSYYGWSNKLFRVMTITEVTLDDGSLGAELSLIEYNAQVYDDKPITQFQPSPNGDFPSIGYFGPLTAPTVINPQQNAAVPSFSVRCLIPPNGQITSITLFYTTSSTPSATDWNVLATQTNSNFQPFTNGAFLTFTNILLPTGTYYFAFSVKSTINTSALSPSSLSFSWLPNPSTTSVAGTFIATWSPVTIQVPFDGVTATFTGISPQLYGTTSGGSVDYINAGTDADTLFVNNSWRIGASSTTGLADIVANNITIGSPTDAGNYAQFPTPTAMAANNATLSVPVRYKDTLGVVYQGATAILQFTYSIKGDTGQVGSKYATAVLYQWATTTPSNPNGTSTYTWATGENTAYTGTNGWSVTIPTNPGIPLIKLYTATKQIFAFGTDVTTTVSWASGFSIQAVSQNGADGLQSARAVVYQWAITIPVSPTGSATYTWASSSFTPIPAGWATTGGTAPSPGYTLWEASVSLLDSAAATTTSFNWSTSSIGAVGYAGSDGSAGIQGASARICYTKTTLSSLNSTPATITTVGSVSFPPNNSWGAGTVWQATPPAIVAGESVYQSDGIFNPSTNNTVWNVPYLSALKVGALSAITVNAGEITAGILRNSAYTNYFNLNATGTSIAFQIGSGLNIQANGTASFTGTATINSGTIQIGTGYSASGKAFEVNSSGTVWTDNLIGGIGYFNNFYYNFNPLFAVSDNNRAKEAIFGSVSITNGNGSAHGVRGINYNKNTSGLIGAANGYDFYADGGGTNYGPFTGTHDSLVHINSTYTIGDIVIDVETIEKNGVSSTISLVETSTSANQPNALGVVCNLPKPLNLSQPAVYIESFDPETNEAIMKPSYYIDCDLYDIMPINSVGEGQINVCGENGNINAGDFIVTSSIAGKGMKQNDDILHTYTVAKARESVTFTTPDEIKMIACIYVSG